MSGDHSPNTRGLTQAFTCHSAAHAGAPARPVVSDAARYPANTYFNEFRARKLSKARMLKAAVHASRFSLLGSCSGSGFGSRFSVRGSGFEVLGSWRPAVAGRKRVFTFSQRAITNREPRTANRELRTANRELRTANCEPRTANREPRTPNRTRTRTEQREPRSENDSARSHVRAARSQSPSPRARRRALRARAHTRPRAHSRLTPRIAAKSVHLTSSSRAASRLKSAAHRPADASHFAKRHASGH
jgi:hypothetical protein